MLHAGKPEAHITMEIRVITDLFRYYRRKAMLAGNQQPDTSGYMGIVSSLRSRLENKKLDNNLIIT